FKQWSGKDSSGNAFNYAGNEMAAAPRFIGNTRLTWTPLDSVSAQLEWIRIGSYYLQDSNAGTTAGADKGVAKYAGYDLFNLRASYDLCKNATVFGRVMNIADKRYADSASVSSSTAVYSPGLPRTFFAGLEVKW
ncbi:MAG: TonB-dependent receptor, partial [Verrucomicrobia bacterium]|nr:TonB-dependent receptor [Verrucomicrobiota bacterium]